MTKTTNNTATVEKPDAGASDLLRRAIARHSAAYAYLDATAYLSDDGVLGRSATEGEQAIFSAASDIEQNALSDVCYFPARTPADLAAKAHHLLKFNTSRFGELEGWQVDNILLSMLPEDQHDAALMRVGAA